MNKNDTAAQTHTRVNDWRRQGLSCAAQLAGIICIWLVGLGLCSLFGWPQLAGVTGMLLLWLALAFGWLRLEQVRLGAGWLLTHMLLFFVPAVLVVMDHKELLGWVGIKLFAVIAVGTVLVMAATALSIEWCLRWSRRRDALARLRRGAHADRSASHVA